jgi:hypothetical protein
MLLNYAQMLGTTFYDGVMMTAMYSAGQVFVRLGIADKFARVR